MTSTCKLPILFLPWAGAALSVPVDSIVLLMLLTSIIGCCYCLHLLNGTNTQLTDLQIEDSAATGPFQAAFIPTHSSLDLLSALTEIH